MSRKKHTLNEILNDPTRMAHRTHGLGGILASLFRKIMADKNVRQSDWERFMRNYLRDPRNLIGGSKRDQTSMRGNIAKELLSEQQTWKVFCKGLVFMECHQVEFSVKMTNKLGQSITTCIPVNFGLSTMDFEDAPQSEDDQHDRTSKTSREPTAGPQHHA